MTQLNASPPPTEKDGGNMVLILIAVALGIVTIVLTNVYIVDIRKQVEGATETVYRLNRSIDVGDKLREQDLSPVVLPLTIVEDFGKFITRKDLAAWKGEPLLQPARQGELLNFDMFTGRSTGGDLGITEGKVGCPIPVSSEGRPGALQPGMYVDIFAPVMVPGRGPKSMVVMERVRIFAVGNRTRDNSESRSGSSYGNVTVEATPAEAQQLFTVQQWLGKSEFRLVVRNPGDTNVLIIDGGVNPELLKLIEQTGPDMDVRGRSGR